MSRQLTKLKTPEEEELDAKLEELSALESELAERELHLATLGAELDALERRYLRIVGARFAELDRIAAEIAEALAKRAPENQEAMSKAREARSRAKASWQAAGGIHEPSEREKFKPSENLKDLYRQVAKRLHPDLATDETERKRRTRFMAEANKAYQEGDEERLREILREWESSPEAIEGEGVGANLVRTIRKIAQVKRRLQAIGSEFDSLMKSELFELKTKVEEAKRQGRDIFAEMAAQVDLKIEETRKTLHEIKPGRVV